MANRIVFMGSPAFALPSLQMLAQDYKVVGVITQPDQPSGRGRKLTPPPVKILASELDIPFIQPQRLREPEALDQLHQWEPDFIVVAAFGQILRHEIIDMPEKGCINVHASLLPRWRGAAPIQAAILHGDKLTGISIMLMDAGIDTGPILSQAPETIQAADTSETLSNRLSQLGAKLLIDTLPSYLEGKLQPMPQRSEEATYAPMLKKQDGELNLEKTASELERQVRAFNPWPGAFIPWENNILKIHTAFATDRPENEITDRNILQVVYKGLPALSTKEGLLVLSSVQPSGKRMMDGKSFLLGAKNWGVI